MRLPGAFPKDCSCHYLVQDSRERPWGAGPVRKSLLTEFGDGTKLKTSSGQEFAVLPMWNLGLSSRKG